MGAQAEEKSPENNRRPGKAGDTELSTKEICDRLRRRRETLGRSVKQAAEDLKIRPELVEAVEAGNLLAATSRVYFLGYLKSYASYLGLDAEEVLREFKQADDQSKKKNAVAGVPLGKSGQGYNAASNHLSRGILANNSAFIGIPIVLGLLFLITIISIIWLRPFGAGSATEQDSIIAAETHMGMKTSIAKKGVSLPALRPPSYTFVRTDPHFDSPSLPQKLSAQVAELFDAEFFEPAPGSAPYNPEQSVTFLALEDTKILLRVKSGLEFEEISLAKDQYLHMDLQKLNCVRSAAPRDVAVYLQKSFFSGGLHALPCSDGA